MSSERLALAVACFDPTEWRTLSSLLHDSREEPVAGSRYPLRRGLILGLEVTLLRLPFGDQPRLLRNVLRAYLQTVKPEKLVILGTCLALDDGLSTGQIVRIQTAHFHQKTLSQSAVIEELFAEISPAGMSIPTVETVTVDRFVPSSERAVELQKRFPTARVAEMEDFHVFNELKRWKIPLLVLRIVTDRGSFRDHLHHLPAAAVMQSRLLRRLCGMLRMRMSLRWYHSDLRPALPSRCIVRRTGGLLSIPEAVSTLRFLVTQFPEMFSTEMGTVYEIKMHSVSCDHEVHPESEMEIPEIVYHQSTDADWPVYSALPALHSAHVQGVNSVSAEPVEGWLAAATVAELRAGGVQIVTADETDYWIYRTADAAIENYFRPEHPVPWPAPWPPPPGVKLLATGVGPRIDPGSPAGFHADLLLTGDETGGRLLHLLDDLGGRPVTALDVFKHPGVILRLTGDTVVFSSCNIHAFLTPEALNRQQIQPQDVRRIYSEDYDRFFHQYFSTADPERPSLLFSTSRGCGKRCVICCCGGHVPWTPLAEDHLVEFLRLGLREAEKTSGCSVDLLDVFLLDSEFNGMRGRIGTITRRLEQENLLGRFRFHVRHNSVHGFLLPGKSGCRKIDRDALRSCRKLGITELVLGVDGWTDSALRILKTDVRRLARDGQNSQPFCSIAEIEALLEAAADEGLGVRAFMLSGVPFCGDDERVEAFYRLLRVGRQNDRFRLDTDSSTEVNQLKPFHGSPLGAVVEEQPDWCRNNHLVAKGTLHDFPRRGYGDLLGKERRSQIDRQRYWRQGQQLRLELIERLSTVRPNHIQAFREAAAASLVVLTEEERIISDVQRLTHAERKQEIKIRRNLVQLSRKIPVLPLNWKNLRGEWFFRRIQEIYGVSST